MSDFVTTSVNSRVITAFFDTREAAQTASDNLISLGVHPHQMQLTEGHSDLARDTTRPADTGFWESLKNTLLPQEDHHSYAEGLRRGGYLLSAQVDNDLYGRALEVVDTDGAVNMDEREASWRSSGWAERQPDGQSMGTGTGIGAAEGMASEPALTTPIPTLGGGGFPEYDSSRVWTRDTSHGRERLRSYSMPINNRNPLPDVNESSNGSSGMGNRFSAGTDSGRIAEHMDVIASDGMKIGTVDHLEAGSIKLAKSTSSDGEHHYVSLAQVDHVDTHVHLNKSAAETKGNW
jgi:hypothetical protein